MRLHPIAVVSLTAAASALAACGGGNGDQPGANAATASEQVTIYSSQPLQGTTGGQARGVINGERLALAEHGGKGGACRVSYVPLDDSTAAAAQWDPGAVSANARKALGDKSAIAYLGEFNSGASAVAIPILNQMPLLEISPSATYVGLTKAAGAAPGEPAKYYPSGRRTFGRVVPADNIQAAAVVEYMKREGTRRVFILNDGETYGSGLAQNVAGDARRAGITVLANQRIDEKAANYRSLAQAVTSRDGDSVFFGGNTYGGAIQLWKDLYAANPQLKLFGPDGVAESSFYSQVGAPGRNTFITVSTLPPKYYPPAAQRFFANYRARFGTVPETYAIYGYEAMSVVLDAMRRAKDCADRRQVIDAFFATRDRRSVLGTYSIDRDGDTTLTRYGGYKIVGGQLVFNTVLQPEGT